MCVCVLVCVHIHMCVCVCVCVCTGLYITVKILDRFPPSSTTMFKLQEDVWEVDAEGVVARQLELLPALARRTRHSGSAKSLWQLSDEETSRLELAAEESFAALELDVTKRKRGSRKENDSEKEARDRAFFFFFFFFFFFVDDLKVAFSPN